MQEGFLLKYNYRNLSRLFRERRGDSGGVPLRLRVPAVKKSKTNFQLLLNPLELLEPLEHFELYNKTPLFTSDSKQHLTTESVFTK